MTNTKNYYMSDNISKIFVEKWEKIRQRERLNTCFSNNSNLTSHFSMFFGFGVFIESSLFDFYSFNKLLPNQLLLVVLLIIVLYFAYCWVLEKNYLKTTPTLEDVNSIKHLNKSCHEIEKQNKTEDQIRSEIASLIDDLNLGNYKDKLLSEMHFNYRLKCFDDEDYSRLGNTRLGGLPDLPKDMEYPHNENGYYNLLCQINFAEFENKLDKLPEKGILYIFNGHESEDDYFTYFSKSTENLEKKYPPTGMKNLNEEYKSTFYDGLKVRFEIEHLFGETQYDVYEFDKDKYQALFESNSCFESHILGRSKDSIETAYLYLKGFDTLKYEIPLDIESRVFYQKQIDSCLNECLSQPKSLCPIDYEKKKEQLLKFDSEKEIHFNNYNKVTCLIGLESLERLEWMWSDSGFKYVYILDEDLQNENFNNLLVETWSS